MSLLPENVLQEMKSYYGYEIYDALKATEQNILAYVWYGESVSNIELQQMLGLNSIEVGKILHNMVEKQLLKRENKNRWTTYSVIKKSEVSDESDKKEKIIGDKKETSDNESVNVGDKKSKAVSDKKRKRVTMSEFTDIERKVFELIMQDVSITYETLGEKLSVSKTTLYKAVRSLKENKIIAREGGRKNGHWVIKSNLGCTE